MANPDPGTNEQDIPHFTFSEEPLGYRGQRALVTFRVAGLTFSPDCRFRVWYNVKCLACSRPHVGFSFLVMPSDHHDYYSLVTTSMWPLKFSRDMRRVYIKS